MLTGRLGFQKFVLAAEIAVIVLGVLLFAYGHSWMAQPELNAVLQRAGKATDEIWNSGNALLEEWMADDPFGSSQRDGLPSSDGGQAN